MLLTLHECTFLQTMLYCRTFAREASNLWFCGFWHQIEPHGMRGPLSYKMEKRLPWGPLRQRKLRVQEITYSL
jgi:hypothetical protein